MMNDDDAIEVYWLWTEQCFSIISNVERQWRFNSWSACFSRETAVIFRHACVGVGLIENHSSPRSSPLSAFLFCSYSLWYDIGAYTL